MCGVPPYPDNITVMSDSKSLVVLALTTFLELAFLLEKLGLAYNKCNDEYFLPQLLLKISANYNWDPYGPLLSLNLLNILGNVALLATK